ncbi:hypothetical protein [Pseudomonas sp.]|uniref:hypothetical protein n=1 Tax=Pseudomonas sp. TaxID=306 RepID=UPI003FD741A3
MSDALPTTLICRDAGDSSGDIVIDIPPDRLAAMGVGLGDFLSRVGRKIDSAEANLSNQS